MGAKHSLRLPFGKPRFTFGKPCVADGGERGGGGGGRGLLTEGEAVTG